MKNKLEYLKIMLRRYFTETSNIFQCHKIFSHFRKIKGESVISMVKFEKQAILKHTIKN